MSKVNTFRCDGCGKLREKDSNHWWSLLPLGKDSIYPELNLAHFEEDAGANNHYCGEECAQAAIQRWMATGKLEPASATPIQREELPTVIPADEVARNLSAAFERSTAKPKP